MVVDSRVPASPCWHCGAVLDAAAGSRMPAEGDATLCTFCAEWNVFGEGLKLRRPTDEEAYKFAHVPAWVSLRRYLQDELARQRFEERGG